MQNLFHTEGFASGQIAAEQMIEGNHGVGFPPAEIGLQFDHRFAAVSREPLQGQREKVGESFREISPAEELLWVLVLVLGFTGDHLGQVGGELCLLVPAAGHVGVGSGHLPPRLQSRKCLGLSRNLCLSF